MKSIRFKRGVRKIAGTIALIPSIKSSLSKIIQTIKI
jgi:hypothetical protein